MVCPDLCWGSAPQPGSPEAVVATAHVVYRSKVKSGQSEAVRLNVATLRKSDEVWKMAIPEEFAGPMRQGRRPGNLAAINVAGARAEPLGHVLDGDSIALILYRTSMPAGDSSISKLAVMPLVSRDPAFDAVRTDNLPEVQALLESRLGLKPTTAPLARNMAPKKSSTRRPGGITKAAPRIARTPPKTQTRKPEPSNTSTTTSGLPERLVDVPATFRGGDRDRFHDIAPARGVLVGARVSYITRFGGPKRTARFEDLSALSRRAVADAPLTPTSPPLSSVLSDSVP